MPIPNTIAISGRVYIKYVDEDFVLLCGDLLLLLNTDSIKITKSYDETNIKGYIKAKVYDGKVWQNIDITEFCKEKENKLVSKQRAIDSFLLCKEILITFKDTLVHKTYRGHFSTNCYQKESYIQNKKHGRRKT